MVSQKFATYFARVSNSLAPGLAAQLANLLTGAAFDRHTGQAVPGKFEFTYRDSTRRQRWQTAKRDTKADAKAEGAEMLARLHRGERVERSSRTVGEVADAHLFGASRLLTAGTPGRKSKGRPLAPSCTRTPRPGR